MKQSILYTLKVWLTTILVTPALRLLMAWMFNLPTVQLSLTHSEYYLMAIYMGFIFSIPAAIMFWAISLLLNRKPLSINTKKLYLSAIALVEILLTFHFVFWLPGSLKDNIVMTLPYGIITGAGLWIYAFRPPDTSKIG
jgi:hypothetical protein